MLESRRVYGGEAAPHRLGLSLPLLCAGALLSAAACGDPAGRSRAELVPPPQPRSATAPLATTPGTPAHVIYAQNGFTCEACHPCGTRSPDGHLAAWMDPAGPGFHASAANQGLASCQACHGAALDGVGGSTTVSCAQCHGASWKTSCTMCHGGTDDASGAPPKATWGNAADAVRVGAHTSHVGAAHALAQPVGCATCHPVPQDALSPGHVDAATATVTFGGLAAQGVGSPPAWDRAQATCSNTYCHGATLPGGARTAPVWTSADGSYRACDACHGAPPPAPHTSSTTCGNCHPGYTLTSVNPATHVNGSLEATSPHAAGWSDPAQHGVQVNLGGFASCQSCHALTGPTSSCASCHASAGFAAWDTTCTFCHGSRTTGRANPPVDIQRRSVTTNVSVGTHENHVTSTLVAAVACAECHPARAGSVTADPAHVDGNGLAEVAFGTLARTGGAAATYTRTSATSASCASTYCHGRFSGGANSGRGATMSWTSTTQVTCSSCHGAPPSTGEHQKDDHRSCGDCHPGFTRTSVSRAVHLDGTKQVGGTGTRIISWDAASRSCQPTCHGRETW